ncbi:MAG: rod shape-determining protein MreD [SAR324 cluster bacterium]|nr:rod shape-determining protein MreD [SAR324 cluster bacterium]MED5241827.1 rod shape-determining protein MreD [SAR324 cluster bacterium]MED5515743.1 rod shape-determining protein MreD [SAR324 cluster bacterium]MED6340574.1 rod shape-determining protein MreD [SAR324 cluster bacterium]MEE2599057.1 rod shape-determining protein MreD [SAR324 cluster bacterium]
MRLFVTSLSFIIIGLWLNIVFNHYVQIVGLKINWILIFLLIQTFRQLNLGIAFFGILAGLILDALSHGIMGLYGTSFFLTLLITSQIKKVFFANSFTSISLAVFSMSIIEGLISSSILSIFEPELEISDLMLSVTLTLSLLQGLITPVILQFVIWGENLFQKDLA